MKKLFKYCFNKWWRPVLFWALTVINFILSELFRNINYSNISFILLGLGLLALLISVIFQLFHKKWLKSILTLLLFGVSIIVLVLFGLMQFLTEQNKPDHFADNLKIPTNIKISTPADVGSRGKTPDSMQYKRVLTTDFQLYNSSQPGLYDYDVWLRKIGKGTIYLKAYEITQNYALSTSTLENRSSIKVYNPTDSLKRFGTNQPFTIYEGDWGKPYAARFEVWYKPKNGGKERKLLTKNYIIEGWMR